MGKRKSSKPTSTAVPSPSFREPSPPPHKNSLPHPPAAPVKPSAQPPSPVEPPTATGPTATPSLSPQWTTSTGGPDRRSMWTSPPEFPFLNRLQPLFVPQRSLNRPLTMPPPTHRLRLRKTGTPIAPCLRRLSPSATVLIHKRPKSAFLPRRYNPQSMSLHLSVIAHMFNDHLFCHLLRVNAAIRDHFARIGWGLDDAHVVLFFLGGRKFNLSVNSLNVLLGFEFEESLHDEVYESTYREVPTSFFSYVHERWSVISIDSEFVPRSSRGAHIKDDALHLYHHFLASTFFGRIDGLNVVTVQELFILDSMLLGEKLNFGCWLAKQWQFTANHFLCKAPLGSFIILLAQRLHVPLPEPEFLPATYFTIEDLSSMRLLFVNAQGQYQLSRPGVQGPSLVSSADTSSTSVYILPEIEALLEQFAQRLEHRLDTLDERLLAVEQTMRHMARSP
ncbi:hypothetical protein C2S51_001536 [Perilla frutescens var. frutescens]|nr:hypothetical protein C2S51_001536 [Perilla frutescens var. frutescens]